jgi:cyclohexanecarboxylate-CoA ligase
MGGDDLPEGMSSFDAFMETKWEEQRDPESLKGIKTDPNDVILIMFTSGTESDPKGVLHTTNTLLHENRSMIQSTELSEEDVIFIPTSVTHITGLLYGLQMPQMLKAKVVLMDVWHPDRGLEIIARERCTWMVGATPFLLGMGRSPALHENDISCLKTFGCGGAECPPSAITDFVAQVPGCTAGRGYGSTEYPTVSVFSMKASLEKSSTTDGIPVMGTEVRIVDEDGNEVPTGTNGEITARGPECFVGYLDSRLNDNYFDPDGWFHTGDLGRIDPDGFLEVTGRKKDIIIRGGENISAKEVEDTLFRHPDISEVVAVAMPDKVMQEKVCAYVVPKQGKSITLDDLISFLEQTELAKQKWPERLEVVDSFPMTAAGKVKKFLLRQDVREKLGQTPDK